MINSESSLAPRIGLFKMARKRTSAVMRSINNIRNAIPILFKIRQIEAITFSISSSERLNLKPLFPSTPLLKLIPLEGKGEEGQLYPYLYCFINLNISSIKALAGKPLASCSFTHFSRKGLSVSIHSFLSSGVREMNV